MDVKERIIQGSIELMSIQGVKSTTMDEVAHHLGISKRTIYENFEDKRALVLAAVEEMMRQGRQEHLDDKNNCEDVIDELFVTLKYKEKRFTKHHKFSQDIKKYYPDIFASKYMQNIERAFAESVDDINRGIEQGVVMEGINARYTSFVLFETINAIMNSSARMEEITGVPLKEAIGISILSAYRGIATVKGVKKIDKLIEENYTHYKK